MNRPFYILIFFLPVVICAQQPWDKSSPLDSVWKNVGQPGFSAGRAWFINLAFSPSGEPYIAYVDKGNSGKASVMKYDGINWVNVGTAGFSDGEVNFTSLAISSSGQPYVAFMDGGNSDFELNRPTLSGISGFRRPIQKSKCYEIGFGLSRYQ